VMTLERSRASNANGRARGLARIDSAAAQLHLDVVSSRAPRALQT